MSVRLKNWILAALAAGTSAAQDEVLQRQIQQALEDARPALSDHIEGARRSGTRPGELALVCLAGLHDGMDPEEPPMQRALARLGKAKPKQTYDIALRLLVLEACPVFPDREKLAKKDLSALLANRSTQGAFQYYERPSTWDLSNTQYGALGLRAAAAMGLTVRNEVWTKLARTVAAQQAPDGGFCYVPRQSTWEPYPSMTVAGIAVLAICRQAIGDGGKLAAKLEAQVAQGWEWLADQREAIGSPKQRWSYYFHYGLERAAILCDVVRVGDKTDWYSKGAEMLIDAQLSGGGWQSPTDGHPGNRLSRGRGDCVSTSFAVLFLRRKFRKFAGPVTERIVRLVNIGPQSGQADVDECARQLAAQGVEGMRVVTRAMRSDVLPQRRVAAQALQAIAGEQFGFDPDKGRDDNRAAVRRAELWYLKNR